MHQRHEKERGFLTAVDRTQHLLCRLGPVEKFRGRRFCCSELLQQNRLLLFELL